MALDLTLHPRQWEAFESKATEILYGGAAGGGKSHLMRIAAIAFAHAIKGLQVYLFRRTFPELRDNHLNGPTGLLAMTSEWRDSKRVSYAASPQPDFEFSNGSAIRLRHAQREADVVSSKRGPEIHLLLNDELTTFTDRIYRFLRSRVRLSGIEIPSEFEGMFPRILNSSNPGDVGHHFVKAAFIDGHAPMEIWRTPKDEGGMLRQFIPAFLEDNPSLDEEEYEGKLEGLGDPALVRAMRHGDWDIVAGGMFDDLWKREAHILPAYHRWRWSDRGCTWRVDRSYDYGSSKPHCVLWWLESDGSPAWIMDEQGELRERHFYPGTLVAFHEWYGWNGKPNEGSLMTARDQARGVIQREKESPLSLHRVKPGPADPSIYAKGKDGYSIADDFSKEGVLWKRGDNERIGGWELIRSRLKAARDSWENEKPMENPGLLMTEDCPHLIRTLSVAPRCDRRRDDVDTDSEDHALDTARYRVVTKSRAAGSATLGAGR